MVFRTLTLAGGLLAAVGFSQFPEYSQQYTQRLSGAVEALSEVVAAFDADAARLEMSRDTALEDMENAGGMAAARAESMRRVFHRHEKLSNDLIMLQSKPAAAQLTQAWRLTDLDLVRETWRSFRPAVPVTGDALGFGVAGFLAGLAGMSALRWLLGRLWPRRRRVL